MKEKACMQIWRIIWCEDAQVGRMLYANQAQEKGISILSAQEDETMEETTQLAELKYRNGLM